MATDDATQNNDTLQARFESIASQSMSRGSDGLARSPSDVNSLQIGSKVEVYSSETSEYVAGVVKDISLAGQLCVEYDDHSEWISKDSANLRIISPVSPNTTSLPPPSTNAPASVAPNTESIGEGNGENDVQIDFQNEELPPTNPEADNNYQSIELVLNTSYAI